MKYLFVFVLLIVFNSAAKAQLNLVPNPSFEDTVYCPFGTNQIDACQHWLNFGNSPDYFNACTGPAFYGLPQNYGFGYQYAHSGNAMAGVCTYRKRFAPSGPDYREFIGNSLTTPCQIGTKYYLSFHTNWAGNLLMASNNIGLKLSTVPFDSSCKPTLNNFALISSDSILKDTVSWVRIEGSFVADSSYEYLMIGNFYTDSLTDTLIFAPLGVYDAAYYYIDDVCVTTDSIYNQTWTALQELPSNANYKIWPNPSIGAFYFNKCIDREDIKITDLLGRKIDFISACLDLKTCQIFPQSIIATTLVIVTFQYMPSQYQSFRILLQP